MAFELWISLPLEDISTALMSVMWRRNSHRTLLLPFQEHSRYCQSVRYSPDGVFWASAGFDGKIFLYEGKESELITEFLPEGKNAHAGGIYAIAWGSNNKSLLSASGDKTCKLWDVENHKPVTTFVMGDEVEDQQLGCLWSGDFMISVSLSGYINYLDARTPRPVRVVKGHNKPITKMIKDKDARYKFGHIGCYFI